MFNTLIKNTKPWATQLIRFSSTEHPLFWVGANEACNGLHATTILSIRRKDKVIMIGDGQVSLGSTVAKPNAIKVRKLKNNILAGFAGGAADAITLLDKLEIMLDQYSGQMKRACAELAKLWRTDPSYQKLEAVLLISDKTDTLTISGNGECLDPIDGVVAIGSGGGYALAAAKALIDTDMPLEEVARKAMNIAADICIYTNHNFTMEKLE
ncbi:hypothetical protein WA158_002097 [Blastocystis sp. Blastoise]